MRAEFRRQCQAAREALKKNETDGAARKGNAPAACSATGALLTPQPARATGRARETISPS